MEVGTDARYETVEDLLKLEIEGVLMLFTQTEVDRAIMRGRAWRKKGNTKQFKKGHGTVPKLFE